jgi:hypothetical protein
MRAPGLALGVQAQFQVPFPHHLDELPYFGPIVSGSFLGELGSPDWFRTVDSVVAWFGLEPSVSESADETTGSSHLTKRGSKYGRRILWLAARNWAMYTTQGRALFRKEIKQHHLSYVAALWLVDPAQRERDLTASVRAATRFALAQQVIDAASGTEVNEDVQAYARACVNRTSGAKSRSTTPIGCCKGRNASRN